MKHLFLLITSVVIFSNCTKIAVADPRLYVRGKVFFRDIITGQEITSNRENIIVKLATNDSLSNYIYSTKTNAEGYFVFDIPSQQLKKNYFVFSAATISNEEYISKAVSVTKTQENFDQVTIDLELSLKTRTYYYLITNDNAGNPVPNAKVYLYINPVLAAGNNTATASYTYASSSLGELKIKDIPPATFYINASAAYTNSTSIGSINDYSIAIDIGKVSRQIIKLQ